MDQLSENDKNCLIELGSKLEFVDDVKDYCCVDCKVIALEPCISDCGHVFCHNCKISIKIKNDDYHCPTCLTTIVNLTKAGETFKKSLSELYVKCPNVKNGCRTQSALHEIAAHIQSCKCKKVEPAKAETTQVLKMQEQILFMMNKMEQMQAAMLQQGAAGTNQSLNGQHKSMGQRVNNSEVEELRRKLAFFESQSSTAPPQNKAPVPSLRTTKTSASPEVEVLLKKVAQLESKLQPQASTSAIVPSLQSSTISASPEVEALIKKVAQLENKLKAQEHPTFVDPTQRKQVENSVSPETAALLQKISELEHKMQGVNNHPKSNFELMDISETEKPGIANSKYKGECGKEYNILLLGQTGVGKSTFINAFCNYLTFNSLDEARNGKPQALIACQFTLNDENFLSQTVKFGKDDNENLQKGQSATQGCRAYEFPVHDFILRIIDTPGIGDTRGIDQDTLNLEGMLRFIAKYEDLYAICILLKPNEARLTTSFAFCIKQLLCHLHHKASENILFVFTNSRSTFYRPGDTVTPLTEILEQIRKNPPNPKIPFGKNNIFCLDNESFRFLMAMKSTFKFSEDDFNNFGQSWKKSVEESQRMIRYIVEGNEGHGLTPHSIAEMLCVTEARRAIVNLARPMSDLAKNIQMNIQALNQRKDEIADCSNDQKRLEQVLYLPQVSLEIKELDEPRTVCTGPNCRQPYNVGNLVCYHYPQKCHDPCFLDEVPAEVVGADDLRYCWAINKTTADCHQCNCSYRLHLHIYYESKIVNIKVVDPNIQTQLQTKEGSIAAANEMIQNLEDEIDKYKAEEVKLSKYTAALAVYLKQNAMVVCNDSFKDHLLELIENEKSLKTKGSENANIIKGLQDMLSNYETEKLILDTAMNTSTGTHRITIQEVYNIIDEICNMKIVGINFKKLVNAQKVVTPKKHAPKTNYYNHGNSVIQKPNYINGGGLFQKGKAFFGIGKHY